MNQKSTDFDPMAERHWRFLRQSPRTERNIPFVEDCPPSPANTQPRWRHLLGVVAWTLAAAAVVVVAAGSVADAHAGSIAVTSDAADRQIYLTDEACEMKELADNEAYRAVAVVRGKLFTGCWGKFVYGDNQIIVAFPGGVHSVLSLDMFTPIKRTK